jgi:signal peptidase I
MTDKEKSMAKTDEKKKEGGWTETLRTIIYALLIAFFVRTLAYQPFNIPSGSMIPTLLVGDYLFVSKFSYGYSRYALPLGLGFFSGRISAVRRNAATLRYFGSRRATATISSSGLSVSPGTAFR